MNQSRSPYGSQSQHGGSGDKSTSAATTAAFSNKRVYYDPQRPRHELLDTLAEKQAKDLETINSTQLRRFFSHIKELYRRYQSQAITKNDTDKKIYFQNAIEPLFRMVRSKVAYARRQKGQSQLNDSFADFLDEGIRRVPLGDPAAFETFVMHLEAVVGFMYGNGKVDSK